MFSSFDRNFVTRESSESAPSLGRWGGKANTIAKDGDNNSAVAKAGKNKTLAGEEELNWCLENQDEARKMLITKPKHYNFFFYFPGTIADGRISYIVWTNSEGFIRDDWACDDGWSSSDSHIVFVK